MTFSLSCDCSMCWIIKENMRNNFDRIMSEEIQKMLDGEVEREVHGAGETPAGILGTQDLTYRGRRGEKG